MSLKKPDLNKGDEDGKEEKKGVNKEYVIIGANRWYLCQWSYPSEYAFTTLVATAAAAAATSAEVSGMKNVNMMFKKKR